MANVRNHIENLIATAETILYRAERISDNYRSTTSTRSIDDGIVAVRRAADDLLHDLEKIRDWMEDVDEEMRGR